MILEEVELADSGGTHPVHSSLSVSQMLAFGCVLIYIALKWCCNTQRIRARFAGVLPDLVSFSNGPSYNLFCHNQPQFVIQMTITQRTSGIPTYLTPLQRLVEVEASVQFYWRWRRRVFKCPKFFWFAHKVGLLFWCTTHIHTRSHGYTDDEVTK